MELQNIIRIMASMPTQNCGIELENGRYAQIYKTRKPYQNREWPKYIRMVIYGHKPGNPNTTMMHNFGGLEVWMNENSMDLNCALPGYYSTDITLDLDKIREVCKEYKTE